MPHHLHPFLLRLRATLLLLLLAGVMGASAQQRGKFAVKEFYHDVNDLTASLHETEVTGPYNGNRYGAEPLGTTVEVSEAQRTSALQLPPKDRRTYTVNGISFTMVTVEGGTFTMGATPEQQDPYDNEKPAHQVTLSTYAIGETEVTQALWKAVMGSNPSEWKGDNLPVDNVSWEDCQEFMRKLNALTGEQFRLPTEAEWEYAARGGRRGKGYQYSGSDTPGDVAWYDGNSGGRQTHPVGTKRANELGLYDMSGNVWEWCQDWYGDYGSTAQTDPTGPVSGSNRAFRGGDWDSFTRFCRVAFRGWSGASNRGSGLGFRLAR